MFTCNYLYIFLFFYTSILCVSCDEGSSLVFVIDDTRSMWNTGFKSAGRAIMNMFLTEKPGAIKDFVLVTFNDPDVILQVKTESSTTFVNQLNRIRLFNYKNYDCPEYSLSGIEKGLLESRNGSYIYVFTDATAKDYYKASVVKDLIKSKQSQVMIILLGDCGNQSNKGYTVYQEIVDGSTGQVNRSQRHEIQSVLPVLRGALKNSTVNVSADDVVDVL